MIMGAKSIAEFAIRKWVSEHFGRCYIKLTMDDNETVIEDAIGNKLRLVYDNSDNSVYIMG